MSYNTLNIKEGGFPQLDSETITELYKLKESIFKNGQHKGKDFEVVFEAFSQIKKHYGYPKPSTACKSGCIKVMNDLLKNWFKAYENKGGTIPTNDKKDSIDKAMSTSQGGSLVTLDHRRKELDKMAYGDLKTKLKEKIGEEEFKLINGKKPAKKIQVIERLLNL